VHMGCIEASCKSSPQIEADAGDRLANVDLLHLPHC